MSQCRVQPLRKVAALFTSENKTEENLCAIL